MDVERVHHGLEEVGGGEVRAIPAFPATVTEAVVGAEIGMGGEEARRMHWRTQEWSMMGYHGRLALSK